MPSHLFWDRLHTRARAHTHTHTHTHKPLRRLLIKYAIFGGEWLPEVVSLCRYVGLSVRLSIGPSVCQSQFCKNIENGKWVHRWNSQIPVTKVFPTDQPTD